MDTAIADAARDAADRGQSDSGRGDCSGASTLSLAVAAAAVLREQDEALQTTRPARLQIEGDL
jgi:hypothetical protein